MNKEEFDREIGIIYRQEAKLRLEIGMIKSKLWDKYTNANNTFFVGDMIQDLNDTGTIKSISPSFCDSARYPEMKYLCYRGWDNEDTFIIHQSNVMKVMRKGEKVFTHV